MMTVAYLVAMPTYQCASSTQHLLSYYYYLIIILLSYFNFILQETKPLTIFTARQFIYLCNFLCSFSKTNTQTVSLFKLNDIQK